MSIFGDKRSKLCVFVSHCLLAQGVRANGLAKYTPGAVRPLVEFCLEQDINIIQMPCPETLCASGGLNRQPRGKSWYEKNGLRETSASIAAGQVEYLKSLVNEGFCILAIVGMEFSPACAVKFLNRGPVVYKDQGILIEELRRELHEVGLEIPFLGVNMRGMKKLRRDLEALWSDAMSAQLEPAHTPAPPERTA